MRQRMNSNGGKTMTIYGKAIPEQKPMAMQFATAQGALRHRENVGGWVFLPDDNGALWFDADVFTASQVFAHPLTRLRNGKLL